MKIKIDDEPCAGCLIEVHTDEEEHRVDFKWLVDYITKLEDATRLARC